MDVLKLFRYIFLNHLLRCDNIYFNVSEIRENSYTVYLFVSNCDSSSYKSKSSTIGFKMDTLISYQRDHMLSYTLLVSLPMVSISWCLPTLLIPPISTIPYKFFDCIHYIFQCVLGGDYSRIKPFVETIDFVAMALLESVMECKWEEVVVMPCVMFLLVTFAREVVHFLACTKSLLSYAKLDMGDRISCLQSR